jgi:membrane-bound lytic murein transglycosylase D
MQPSAPHLLFRSRATSAILLAAALAQPCVLPAPTRAEPTLFATTWAQEALQGVAQGLESPELRSLRLAEEELFGAGPSQRPDVYDPDCVYGAPDALTSDAPPARLERAQGEVVDLAFLKELKLPSLPVRWDARVIDYLLFFKNDRRGRDLAGAWLKRVERYGPMIRRVMAEHSLPEDLQYVAMIESGYDPLARSAADARGMWQFVKQPAQFYGLRIDHWVDERLDPERATHAAALFMRDLYDKFGSWELAFAAYNMGYGGLLRAIRKYNSNDYWMLSHLEAGMPFETALYVAKITAMAIVANNPDRFGFGQLTREPHVALTKLNIAAGTGLRAVAGAAGVDVEQLKTLNPHLVRGRVPPGEQSSRVYLPREHYDQFAKRWSKQHEPIYVSYITRFGESLEEIARKVGSTPSKLRDINELGSEAKLQPGFPLLVPGVAPSPAAKESVEPLLATVPAKTFRYEDRRRVFYRVSAEDTAASIARFFEVTLDELCAWNSLEAGAVLQRDMLLQLFVVPALDLGKAVVFTPDQVRILTVGSDEFFDFHESQRGRVRVRYHVQPNDTLAKIGERFELSAGSIGRINQFGSNRELKADEWIVMYVPEKQLPELERRGLIKPMLALNVADKSRTAAAPRSPTPTINAKSRANQGSAEEVDTLGLPPEGPASEAPEVP